MRLVDEHGKDAGQENANHYYRGKEAPCDLPISARSVSSHLLDVFRESACAIVNQFRLEMESRIIIIA
jgi:hypothetical protein